MSTPSDMKTRRDFMQILAAVFGGVGGAFALWPFISSLNPPMQGTDAPNAVDVDISAISVGEAKTVIWQGKPVFIRHRTGDEIKQAQEVNSLELSDKQADSDRVKRQEWLVTVGVCTHLGCVPSGQKITDNRGEYGGWFCPCHGSHFDTSGRIRKGPAPKNMIVPPYEFINDTTIRIG